jgi:hypothetical protein
LAWRRYATQLSLAVALQPAIFNWDDIETPYATCFGMDATALAVLFAKRPEDPSGVTRT